MSTLLAFPAAVIPLAHTIIAALAFSVALFAGWTSGLWEELCENAVSGELVTELVHQSLAPPSRPGLPPTSVLLLTSDDNLSFLVFLPCGHLASKAGLKNGSHPSLQCEPMFFVSLAKA